MSAVETDAATTLRWQRIRALFDAVADHPPDQWADTLARMGVAPAERDEALDLLRAQTTDLGQIRVSISELARSLDAPEAWVGSLLGPWRLTRLVGSGGMGAVFLAERADRLYRREVAVKVLRQSFDPRLASRLADERQILADLRGDGIARLYDAGVSDAGQHYLVMEHVDGRTLDAFVATLGFEARLRLFVRICRIVQTAHAQSVVHCDLKPGNVLVDPDGAPVLLDFGIARLLGVEAGSPADACFTPAYASPELVAGRAVGVASDVFSLGVMLAELMAGRSLRRDAGTPVSAPSLAAAADCRWRHRLVGDIDAVVIRACADDPVQRYASAEALADDVERFLERRPVRARPQSRARVLWLAMRRHWQLVLAVVAVVLMTALFVIGLQRAQARADSNAVAATQVSEFLVAAFEAADPRERGGQGEMSAREILDQSASRVAHDLAMAPDLQARMQIVLGRAYQNLGQPRVAEQQLLAASKGFAARGDWPQAFEADSLLALQLGREGRYRDAAARLQPVIDWLDAQPDAVTPLLALRAAHAQVVLQAGLHPEVAPDERTLRARITAAKAADEDPALQRTAVSALNDLGAIHAEQGRLDVAEATQRMALEAAARTQGESSADYQRVLASLSRTLFLQGRMDESVALAERSLALTEGLFGSQGSHSADARARVAGLYLDLGRYDTAAAYFERSLRISADVDGRDSRAYAGKLFASGIVEDARGGATRAEALYSEAIALHRAHLGADHGTTLDAEMVLARLLMRAGRVEEAGVMLRRVAAAQRARLPADAPDIIALALVELEWLIRADRAEAPAELARLAALRADWTPGMVLRWEMQAALLSQRQRDWPRAVDDWRAVVERFSSLYGADSTATAKWRIPLAECLFEAGAPDEALRELRRARPLLAELAPEADLRLRADALEARM